MALEIVAPQATPVLPKALAITAINGSKEMEVTAAAIVPSPGAGRLPDRLAKVTAPAIFLALHRRQNRLKRRAWPHRAWSRTRQAPEWNSVFEPQVQRRLWPRRSGQAVLCRPRASTEHAI
jgi:hypothetical protein